MANVTFYKVYEWLYLDETLHICAFQRAEFRFGLRCVVFHKLFYCHSVTKRTNYVFIGPSIKASYIF